MDYKTFFDDLRDCYLANGMPFEHDFIESVCAWSSQKSSNVPWWYTNAQIKSFKYEPLTRPAKRKYPLDFAPIIEKSLNLQNASKTKGRAFSKKIRLFNGVSDMVYTLALELSGLIGRLPDHIHNRMVFSLDNHPAIASYIEAHGL